MYQRKVDVPMYPDRNRCEQKLNNKLTQLGYDKIDLHPGEYLEILMPFGIIQVSIQVR